MVGSLIYLAITRPDLSYAIGIMSQFMQKPCKGHLDAIQRILRFVKATCMYGLFYEKGQSLTLYGYIDFEWARNVLDWQSTSGYEFSLGSAMIN